MDLICILLWLILFNIFSYDYMWLYMITYIFFGKVSIQVFYSFKS